MKKTVFILSAVFALVACSKEKPVTQNDGPIDPSKVVFNFTVKHADDTKAIKTDWVDGDVVYVFFNYTSPQWVKLTRSSSSWTFTNKDGDDDYTGLDLASRGNVTAVYANAATPSIDGSGNITFANAQPGYLLTATAEYTVTSTTKVTTLSATLDMRAPANLIQVYVPELSALDLGSGNEYVLNMTNVKPFTVGSITPGNAVTVSPGTANFPLAGVNTTIGSKAGYYFWGILDNPSAGEIYYNFQVVERNAEKKYAISSKSKTEVSAELTGSKAIKLTSLTDNGNFVNLDYTGGPLWATGNLNDNGTIADPLAAGDYYKWCYTTPYDVTGETDPYSNYIADGYDTAKDPAYVKSGGVWAMPSAEQLDNLVKVATTNIWVGGWTSLGGLNGGRLFTSKSNGTSLFFAAAGEYDKSSTARVVGDRGNYWLSSASIVGASGILQFENSNYCQVSIYYRYAGYPVRPIKN